MDKYEVLKLFAFFGFLYLGVDFSETSQKGDIIKYFHFKTGNIKTCSYWSRKYSKVTQKIPYWNTKEYFYHKKL